MDSAQGDEPKNKIDLILYRLQQIEAQTKGLVSTDLYRVEQMHIQGRVASLETAAEKRRSNERTLWVGVGLALLIPVLSNLDALIQVFAR